MQAAAGSTLAGAEERERQAQKVPAAVGKTHGRDRKAGARAFPREALVHQATDPDGGSEYVGVGQRPVQLSVVLREVGKRVRPRRLQVQALL